MANRRPSFGEDATAVILTAAIILFVYPGMVGHSDPPARPGVKLFFLLIMIAVPVIYLVGTFGSRRRK